VKDFCIEMYVRAATATISGMLLCVRYKKQFDYFLQRLYDSLISLITPRFYVFFDEYSMPFPAHNINLDRFLAAEPTLVYNVETSAFFPYLPNVSFADMLVKYKANPLPILSLEIIDNYGNSIRDLTGFVEDIRYIHVDNSSAPTVADIVAAWSVTNAIPIDRSRFRIRYFTEDGDELEVPLKETIQVPVTVPVQVPIPTSELDMVD
jgi:hypothetical protein